MKNIAILSLLVLTFSSCKKDSEQVAAAKADLKTNWNKTDEEIKEYDFDVVKITDRDMYDYLQRKNTEDARSSRAAGSEQVASEQLKLAAIYLDSVATSKGDKTFYMVHGYRTLKRDTIANGYLLLNDRNQKIGFRNRK